MHNPAIILVSIVVLVCGYTAFSFFQRAYEAGAQKTNSTTKVIVKAVRLRYNLIMGAILTIFAISGLIWVVKNW